MNEKMGRGEANWIVHFIYDGLENMRREVRRDVLVEMLLRQREERRNKTVFHKLLLPMNSNSVAPETIYVHSNVLKSNNET